MLGVSIGFASISIKEILNDNNTIKNLIILLLISPLFLLFLINDIRNYIKLGKIVLDINEDRMIYTNEKTNEINNIPLKDIIDVFNGKSSRGVLCSVGIVVDKKYVEYGAPIFFDTKECTIEFTDINHNNSVFVLINTSNSKISNESICEKIDGYLTQYKHKNLY